MSLKDCLAKIGLDEHEGAIIAGAAAAKTGQGMEENAAAVAAVGEYVAGARTELTSVLQQIREQTGLAPMSFGERLEERLTSEIEASGYANRTARLYARMLRNFYETTKERAGAESEVTRITEEMFDKLRVRAGEATGPAEGEFAQPGTAALDPNDPGILRQEFDYETKAPLRLKSGEYRRNAAGDISGAPPGVKTEKDINKIVRKNLKLLEGELITEQDLNWYETSAAAIRELTRGQPQLMEDVIRIMATLSADNQVGGNVTGAVKAAYQLARGDPVMAGRYPKTMLKQMPAILGAEELNPSIPGISDKVMNFYRNLWDAAFQSDRYERSTTMDLWMARLYGYPEVARVEYGEVTGSTNRFGAAQYRFANMVTARITEAYNKKHGTSYKPRHIQAGLWSYARSRDKGKTQYADFATYLDRAKQHVTAEAVPSTSYEPGQFISTLTPDQKARFTKEIIENVLQDESGNDVILERLLAPLYQQRAEKGAFEGAVSPNITTSIVADKVGGKPKTDLADIFSLSMMYVMSQDAVPWFQLDPTLTNANPGVSVRFSSPLTYAEAQAFLDHLAANVDDAGFSTKGNDILMIRFGETRRNKAWESQVRGAVGTYTGPGSERIMLDESGNVDFQLIKATGNYHDVRQFHKAGWADADGAKNAIEAEISARGRPDLLDTLRVRRAAFEQHLAEVRRQVEAGEYTTSVTYEQRAEPGTGDEGAGGRTERVSAPPVRADGRVELTHYTRRGEITTIDPSRFGTDAAGAERMRREADPDNWRDRSYYGIAVDQPGGYVREPQLGFNRLTASIDPESLYDFRQDPLELLGAAKAEASESGGHYLNIYERMIVDSGYAGYWMNHPSLGMVAAVFAPLDVESRRLAQDGSNILMQGAETAPIFYSQMQRTLAEKLPGKGTPSSMKQAIQAHAKKGLFKQEELEWSGVEEWLDSIGPRKVTKGEVLDFLQANEIRVEEVEKGSESTNPGTVRENDDGGWDVVDEENNRYIDGPFDTQEEAAERLEEWWEEEARIGSTPDSQGATKFAQWQLPGAEEGSYRELLLTLPVNFNKSYDDLLRQYRDGEITKEEYLSRAGNAAREGANFTSSHFDETNVLAHVRFNERTDADGKRVLFIEETQSDWHQLGRKEGYSGDDIEVEQNVYGNEPGYHAAGMVFPTMEEARAASKRDGVPNAPFKTTWPLLAMKRMIRYAAENGFDRIAWATGEQQAERYDLSKQVDEVRIVKNDDGTFDVAAMKNREGSQGLADVLLSESNVSAERVAELVGKDLAEKAQAQKKKEESYTDADLKVGGEGMKGFYDKMLPSMVNKYVKKWGAKTSTTDIGQGEGEWFLWDGNTRLTDAFPTRAEAEEANQELYGGASEVSQERDGRGGEGSTSVHSLDITPAMREAAMQGQPLFQSTGPPRGSIELNAPSGETIIRAFEGRNLSTMLHESGHFYLEVLRAINENADIVPEQMRRDWQTILDYLGVKSGAEIKREHHEKWARANEAYLYEGKAPSIGLRDAFRNFKAWLVNIYRDIRKLNAPLNDDIRAVFDRMLATDTEIEEAATNPLFSVNPDVLSILTSTERAAYLKQAANAKERAKERLLKKALNQLTRSKKKWWKAEREQVLAEAYEKLNRKPVYQAIHFLQTGELLVPRQIPLTESLVAEGPVKHVRLDRKTVVELYGEEAAKALPRATMERNGEHPDVVADLFGISSGEKLVKAMAEAVPRKQLAEQMADQTMLERHGDVLADGTIEQEALDSLQNDEVSALIATELQAIAKKAKTHISTRKAYEQRAKQILASKKVGDATRPAQYYQAEVRAARAAGKALGKRDYEAAGIAKAKQLLNHYLYRESLKARRETQGALRRFRKYLKRPSRKKVKIHEDYRQKIVELLDNYNLAPRLSEKRRERLTAAALENWMRRKEEDDGAEFITPSEIEAADNKTHYSELTLQEFRTVADLADNLAAQGTQIRTAMVEGKRVQIETIAEELKAQAKKGGRWKEPPLQTRTPKEERRYRFEALFSSVLKARTMLRELDNFEDLGPWTRYLIRDIDKAEVAKVRRLRQVGEELDALFKKHLGERVKDMKRYKRTEYIEEIDNELTREGMLAFALNWGNADNRAKLLEGYRNKDGTAWTEEQGMAILSRLTKKEWEFVQSVWDYLDTFWPEISALERRRTGIEPKKVPAEPFVVTTQDGEVITLDGGYYPIKADDRASPAAADLTAKDMVDLMRLGRFSAAQTARGHVEARSASARHRIRLDLGPLFQHVNSVVNDLTMGEPLENAYKILRHRVTQEAIYNTSGPNVAKQLEIWLKDLAVGGIMAEAGWASTFDGLRAGVSVSVMGFKLSTVLIQITGYSHSFERLGFKYGLLGLAKFMGSGSPMAMNRNVAMVFEKSKYMKDRATTFHRDIFDALRLLESKGHIRPALAKAGFWPIVKMQLMVDIPTWLGAYQKGLAKWNGDESKAVEFADEVLVQTQASGFMKDLSGFERGSVGELTRLSSFVRLFGVFYSYFNAKLNLAYESAKRTDFKKPGDVARLATDYAMLFWLEAVIGEMILQRAPSGDDDEESTLWWHIKMSLSNMAATLPGLREISSVAQGFGGAPPGLRGLEELGRSASLAASQAAKAAEEGIESIDIHRVISTFGSAAGILFKVPGTAQLVQTVRAMGREAEGEEVTPIEYGLYIPRERR